LITAAIFLDHVCGFGDNGAHCGEKYLPRESGVADVSRQHEWTPTHLDAGKPFAGRKTWAASISSTARL